MGMWEQTADRQQGHGWRSLLWQQRGQGAYTPSASQARACHATLQCQRCELLLPAPESHTLTSPSHL